MRFYLANIEIARSVANRLRGALKDRGYARTHTKRLSAVSAMFGYASWSDLTAHCPSDAPASPFDPELSGEQLKARHQYQAEALAKAAHVPLPIATEVVAEVRPTGSASGNGKTQADDIDEILVEATVHGTTEAAFEYFVYKISDWWPNAFTFSMAALDEIVLEATPGGRWYEKSLSGDETDWGVVIACDHPHRIVMTFQISATRTLTSRERASEISFQFFACDGACVVRLTHTNLRNHGSDAKAIRENMSSPQGWRFILDSYTRNFAEKFHNDEKAQK